MNRIARIEHIKKKLQLAAEDNTRPASYPIKNWQGGETIYLKIIRVSIENVMFRIENSRTEIQQLAYVRQHPELSPTIFKDPESTIAQKAQEQILNEINKKAGKAFFEDLEERGQEDPAIITYDGFLVNGNRRTAALKSLGETYINCVVLPEDASARDIYELEQELQISQDFREDYHWLNELQNIRRGLEDKRYKYSENQMAKRLRIDEKTLRQKIKMMNLVDSFLSWKKIPAQYDYSKLDDAEQAFIEMEKAAKKITDPITFQNYLDACFILIDERPPVGRLYTYITYLSKNFNKIFEKVKSEVPPSNSETSFTIQSDNVFDELDALESKHANLFSNSDKVKDLSPILIEKIEDVKAENKDIQNSEGVYNSVSMALRELQSLIIDEDTSKIEAIKNKLQEIIIVAHKLLDQI